MSQNGPEKQVLTAPDDFKENDRGGHEGTKDGGRVLPRASYIPFLRTRVTDPNFVRSLSRQQKIQVLSDLFESKLPTKNNDRKKQIAAIRKNQEKLLAIDDSGLEKMVEAELKATSTKKSRLPSEEIVSQLGYLFLERIRFEPVGSVISDESVGTFNLGVGSDSKLVVSKKTWSKTSTEFSETISQVKEEERSSSLTQSKEMSESTEKQNKRDISFGSSVQASGKLGIFNTSASANFDMSSASSETASESTKQSSQSVADSAARMKEEHKTSFTVSTEAGTELTTTLTLVNPNATHPATVTLYKKLRRWRIRHERHGLRLCVDVMVKNPGKNLRRMLEGDKFPEDTGDPDPNNPPTGAPQSPKDFTETQILEFSGRRRVYVGIYIPNGFELDYVTAFGERGAARWHSQNADGVTGVIRGEDMADQKGDDFRAADLLFNYHENNTDEDNYSRTVKVTAYFKVKREKVNEWIELARPFLKEQERKKWQLQKDIQAAKMRALENSSTAPLAQVLRKEERDELLSAVALFILQQEQTPEPPPSEESSNPLQPIPARKLSQFHESLEWESMSSFLLPYWWDLDVFGESKDKIHLIKHKDFFRQEFLKSSWARVLIPVRKGHEKWVISKIYPQAASYLETGNENAPAPIGDLVRAYKSITRENGQDGKYGYTVDPSTGMYSEPTPEILAEWFETTPTDEETQVWTIHNDVAEPSLRKKLDAEAEIREAIADNMAEIVDKSSSVIIKNDGEMIEMK